MPDYRTHTAINSAALPVVIVGAYAVTHDPMSTGLISAGQFMGGIWLSPDLDLTNSDAAARWGVLRWLWYPYGKVIKHRSALSHSGLSALLRVAYLLIVLEALGAILSGWGLLDMPALNSKALTWLSLNWRGVGCVLAGVVISDVLHTVTDHISTAVKVWHSGGRGYRRVMNKHHH